MARPFLTATWSHLINLTYAAPVSLLEPLTPPGVTLDVRDGHAFVSLVAFDFKDTRVFGVPWPGYRDFPELNLRSYVKRGEERGVFFIREYVPKRLIARMARSLYNEPYVAAPMRSVARTHDDLESFELAVTWGGREHIVRATGSVPPYTPAATSREHYFKEHQWGHGATRQGKPLRYEVQHPVWEVYPLQAWSLELDFAMLYGPQWAFLQDAEPLVTMFAVGSPVAVSPRDAR